MAANTCTTDFQVPHVEPLALTSGAKVVAVIVYQAISALAIGGNVAVCYIVAHFRKLRTPTNLLIVNLALADLLMAALCIPFTYWPSFIIDGWPFGQTMCKVIHFMQPFSVFLSSYTLVAISFDRFLAIIFPLNPSWKMDTKHKAFMSLLVVWILSLVIASPDLFVHTVVVEFYDNITLTQCIPVWTNFPLLDGQNYGMALFFIQYVIPLLVIIVTYAGIGLRLWYTRTPGGQGENQNINRRRRESVKKMIPMMVLISFLYAICWLPQNILTNILIPSYPQFTHHRYILYIYWACHVTAMSHTFVNPIIYWHKNDRFRAGFKFAFRCLPCIKFSHSELVNHGLCRRRTKDNMRMVNSRTEYSVESTSRTDTNLQMTTNCEFRLPKPASSNDNTF